MMLLKKDLYHLLVLSEPCIYLQPRLKQMLLSKSNGNQVIFHLPTKELRFVRRSDIFLCCLGSLALEYTYLKIV